MLIFGYLIFLTNKFQTGMVFEGGNQKFFNGPLFFLFPIYFLFYWIWAVRNLIVKFKMTDGIHIYQLKLLLWGVLISSIIIIIFDIIYPLLGKVVISGLGPEFSIVWLGFTSYIILKK